jgi:hypothetical protein
MRVRDICLQNGAQWKIRINGSVEVETLQPTPAEQGYYQFRGQVGEDELEAFEYRMRHKRPPD